MPKKLTPQDAVPSLVQERLRVWGRCIRAQRITQRITTPRLAARMNISRATLQRLERGDPGASASNYLRAFLVLGILDVVAPVPPQRFWQETGVRRVVQAGGRMTTTSERLYLYLQRPDSHEWVTVGGRWQSAHRSSRPSPSCASPGWPKWKRWRLSPAFDVVPSAVEAPTRLLMQLSLGSCEISRAAVLEDATRFGFASRPDAEKHLDGLLMAIEGAFDAGTGELDADWREVLRQRMVQTVQRLRSA